MAKEKVYLFDHSPHLREEWDYAKNEGIDPEKLTYGSKIKAWWSCSLKHSFSSTIDSRSSLKAGCPFCSNKKVLVGYNDLATTDPLIASEVSPNSPILVTQVTRNSRKILLWVCKLGHEYKKSVNHKSNSSSCPYCFGSSVLIGFNDLNTTHPNIAKELFDKNYDAYSVSMGSNRLLNWKCSKGHEWLAMPVNRTNKNSGCPVCKAGFQSSNQESKLRELLSNKLSVSDETTLNLSYRKNKCMSIDILILGEVNCVIEYDGSKWHSSDKSFEVDEAKTKKLLDSGYLVVRVREQSTRYPLKDIKIHHSNLLQLKVDYEKAKDKNLIETANNIIDWIDSKGLTQLPKAGTV